MNRSMLRSGRGRLGLLATAGLATVLFASAAGASPPASTTISAASDGASLPQSTISVVSTTGFTTSGTILVTTDGGPQTVTYTGITATTFTGAAGGTGILSTGNAVVQAQGVADQLADLLAQVTGFGPGKSLANKVKEIQGYVAANDTTNACTKLNDFLSEVAAQTGKHLTPEQAASFTTQASNIRATLGC